MRNIPLFCRYCLALLALTVTTPVLAVLEIEITQGIEGAVPVAVLPFGQDEAAPAVDLAAIVAADLTRSGRFRALSPEASSAAPKVDDDGQMDFAAWRGQGINYLLAGERLTTAANTFAVKFRLFDTVSERTMLAHSIPAGADQLRQAAHRISDLVFEHLTGIRGAFNTRIAYVTATDDGGVKTYRLQVADADGYRPYTVYEAKAPILSPAWSPDGQYLAYVAFSDGRPHIRTQHLATGQARDLLAKPGLNGAPAWSPDGRQLAVTLSFEGNPEIYIFDLGSGHLSRLTRHRAIDTEPAWSRDGQAIFFTSDRSGRPQIYRQDLSGGDPQRLSFHGDYNAEATPLPDREQLALVHAEQGRFQIGLLNPKTAGIQVLTDGNLDESPTVAPNGSMILYAGREPQGRGVLAAVSVDGRFRQRLLLDEGDIREPAWSPFLDGTGF